jgi:rhodanese-related sulfurtransferase
LDSLKKQKNMKLKKIILFMMMLTLTSGMIYAQEGKDRQIIKEKKFNRLMKKENTVVIDVRTTEEFSSGHIPGALHMDVQKDNFTQNIQALDPSKKYLLYCKSGKRSAKATAILKENGFNNVHHLRGGFQQWNGKVE